MIHLVFDRPLACQTTSGCLPKSNNAKTHTHATYRPTTRTTTLSNANQTCILDPHRSPRCRLTSGLTAMTVVTAAPPTVRVDAQRQGGLPLVTSWSRTFRHHPSSSVLGAGQDG